MFAGVIFLDLLTPQYQNCDAPPMRRKRAVSGQKREGWGLPTARYIAVAILCGIQSREFETFLLVKSQFKRIGSPGV